MRQKLNAAYQSAAEDLTRRILLSMRSRIDSVVLFGSTARGEARRSSDIDILVISPNPAAVRDEISEIRSQLIYERNFSFLLSIVHLSRNEFLELARLGSPFIQKVLAEGVVLYDDGTFSGIRERAVAAS